MDRKDTGSRLGTQGRGETLYEKMVLIRKFEEKLGKLSQETGTLIGMQILVNREEALAVEIVKAPEADDLIVSNHGSHGHLPAKGADRNISWPRLWAGHPVSNGASPAPFA